MGSGWVWDRGDEDSHEKEKEKEKGGGRGEWGGLGKVVVVWCR